MAIKFLQKAALLLILSTQCFCVENDSHPMTTEEHPFPETAKMVMPSYKMMWKKTISSLLFLIAILVLLLWVVKLLQKKGIQTSFTQHRDIQILSRKNLSSKTTLYLVEIQGETQLIIESQISATLTHYTKDKKELA